MAKTIIGQDKLEISAQSLKEISPVSTEAGDLYYSGTQQNFVGGTETKSLVFCNEDQDIVLQAKKTQVIKNKAIQLDNFSFFVGNTPTNKYLISPSTDATAKTVSIKFSDSISASKTYNIPNISTASADVILSESDQTLNGTKKFSSDIIFSKAKDVTLAVTAGASNTAVSLDASTDRSIVTTEGSYTLNGSLSLTKTLNSTKDVLLTYNSLPFLTQKTTNTTVGQNAGANLAANAEYNVALGKDALATTTNSDGNTAIGHGSLSVLTSGTINTALGFGSLGNLTQGSNNVALGYGAGFNLTTGSSNIIIGASTMANAGSYNTVISASDCTVSGSGNVVVGLTTLSGTSSNCVLLGRNTGLNSANLNGSVAIGCDSLGNGAKISESDEIVLGTDQHILKIPRLTLNTVGQNDDSPVFVNTAGYLKKYSTPRVSFGVNTGHSITSGASLLPIDIVSGSNDDMTGAINYATSVFKAPYAGQYLFLFTLKPACSGSPTTDKQIRMEGVLLKGGSELYRSTSTSIYSNSGSFFAIQTTSGSKVLTLSKDEQITFRLDAYFTSPVSVMIPANGFSAEIIRL